MTMMTAGLALACWTIVVMFWMFALRVPAIQKAKIDVDQNRRPSDLNKAQGLPDRVYWVGDNYAHLHEQPVLFYFLMVYSQSPGGVADDLNVALAWSYVGVRIVHSIWQGTVNTVLPRFALFLAGSVILLVILARNVIAALV